MASLFNNLSDDELLLLYLAEELPSADRQALRSRLANDAGLAALLEELRAAQTQCAKGFAQLDQMTPLPVPVDLAARWVVEAMQHSAAGTSVRPRMVLRPVQRQVPWWTYPMAAAACLIISFTLWGVYHAIHMNLSDDVPSPQTVVSELTDSQTADLIESDDAVSDDAPALDQADTVVAEIQGMGGLSSLDLSPTPSSDRSELTP